MLHFSHKIVWLLRQMYFFKFMTTFPTMLRPGDVTADGVLQRLDQWVI